MNVNITTYCNLKCPYCFAVDLWQSAGNRKSDKEISLKNLNKVMDFMKRSGASVFRILGGEPTLHTKFEKVYDTISRHGFSTIIFSNGIIPNKIVEFLSTKDNIQSIVINVQHPQDYSLKQYKQLNFTLSRLGKRIILGSVIYKTNFDISFAINLIEKYNLERDVKISIAAPVLKNKNINIKIEDHKKIISELVKQSLIFKRHRIRWFPDTTFMWCLFTKKQLDELYCNVKFEPVNLCRPPLEIVPNLTVYRCYGTASLTNPKLKITSFKNANDAIDYFSKKEAPFKTLGVFEKCFRCDIKGSVCGAGCMVHILQSLPKKDYGYIY